MASAGVTETAAVGRLFQPGMMYDCRSDALVPGVTLWDQEKLQQSIRTRPQINSDFRVTASDSFEDKSSLLNIDGSLKLSVLGGLINVIGAAKYLKDIKKSFRQQRLTLHYHSTCRFEELTMSLLAPENIINQDVFDINTPTHVVTAVLYGADACFMFDREVSADEDMNTVEGETHMVLEKLTFISADANINLKMNDDLKCAVKKYACKFYSDVQLPSNPTSFEDVLKLFTDLPKLLEEKKELAVPLRVWLYPLDKLYSRSSKVQKDISMDLIQETESVIESLNTAEMRCSDLLKDSPALTFAEFQNKILQMKQNCSKYKLKLTNRLGSLLPNIRGGVMKDTELNHLLQEHEESPFSDNDLTDWLKERERESGVIKSILRQLEDAGAEVEADIDLVLMDLDVGNLVCFMFSSLDWTDVLLLQQKTCLSPSAKGRNNEVCSDTKQKSWLSPEIQKTLRSNLKIFISLMDSKDRKPALFIVSSREMENNPGSCILLYEGECDEAVCFTPPSKPACPLVEEVKENVVVLKVLPSCPDTVELRVLYKPKQDSVWTSEALMKDQHTVTLTDLRSETEYELRCAALGKLNYTVYSDRTAVLTEGRSSMSTDTDVEGDGHSSVTSTEGSPPAVQSSQSSLRRLTVSDVSSGREEASGRGEVTRRCQSINVLKNPGVSSIKQLKPSEISSKSSRQRPFSEPVSSSQMFKLRLKEEIQYLSREGLPGERQKLNEVFMEQHIIEDPDSHISDDRRIMRSNIFEGQKIRTVLLKGDAGAGKTVAVQKFLLDWAEEKSNTHIDYIFPIPLQKLNIIRETVKKCSFMELLQQCFDNTEYLKLHDSDRIMLILDGLNEFNLPLNFQITKRITNIHEQASVSDLLMNLIIGNLLLSAQIWITSRPAAINQIPETLIDRVTEIQGFEDQQKEEYFRKSISDQRMRDKVINHMKTYPRINSMCYLPDYCRIISALPEEIFRTDFPKTLTQMYSKLLLAQTEPIRERKETVLALGRIAYELLVNRNSLFCYQHLKKCGVRDESALIRSSIIKTVEDKSKRKLLCFVNHRTQEFLAALYATEIINVNNSVQLRDLSSLGLDYGELCFGVYCYLQTIMKNTLERQMDVFFCFILGLRLVTNQRALIDLLKQSSSRIQDIVQCIKDMIMSSSSNNTDKCLLFDVLKELNERYLIQEIKTQLKSGLKPSHSQLTALVNLEK